MTIINEDQFRAAIREKEEQREVLNREIAAMRATLRVHTGEAPPPRRKKGLHAGSVAQTVLEILRAEEGAPVATKDLADKVWGRNTTHLQRAAIYSACYRLKGQGLIVKTTSPRGWALERPNVDDDAVG